LPGYCHDFCYFRDELKRHYNLGEYYLEVEIEDVASFDEALAEKLYKLPTEHLPLVRFKCSEIKQIIANYYRVSSILFGCE